MSKGSDYGRMAAFPRPSDNVADGLTKREYFAGLALQGLLMNVNRHAEPDIYAAMAVVQADALLAALEASE